MPASFFADIKLNRTKLDNYKHVMMTEELRSRMREPRMRVRSHLYLLRSILTMFGNQARGDALRYPRKVPDGAPGNTYKMDGKLKTLRAVSFIKPC